VLAYTRLGDPRFANVINGVSFWKIVGTRNIVAIERCKQFKLVLRIPPKVFPAQLEVRKLMQVRTRRLLQRLEVELNDMLDEDPYSDIIGIPIPEGDFGWIGANSKVKYLSTKGAYCYHFTMTFTYWRKSMTVRPALRESFLSFIPQETIARRPLDDLAVMETELREIEENYPNDGHLLVVVKRHGQLIRKEKRDQMRELENSGE
jgi:hypothetical protein